MAEVRWTRNALGYAHELSQRNRHRLLNQVRLLGPFPELGTELLGAYAGKRRLIVGDFQVVYEFDQQAARVSVLFIVYGGWKGD